MVLLPGHVTATTTHPLAPASLGGPGLQASEHRLLLVIGDIVVVSLGVFFALWVWTITAGTPLSTGFVRERIYWFLAIPAWLVCLTPSRHVRTALSVDATIASVLRAAGLLLLVYLALYFYSPRQTLPRLVALYILWEGVLLTLAWRLAYVWLFTQTGLRRRVLIVGAGATAQRARRLLETELRHAEIVGVVDPAGSSESPGLKPRAYERDGGRPEVFSLGRTISLRRNGEPGAEARGLPEGRTAGEPGALTHMVREQRVSEIVIATKGTLPAALVQELMDCQQLGVDLVPLSTLHETLLHRVPVDDLPSDWLLTSLVETVRTNDASRLLKRLVDIVGGAGGLVVALVAWPFIALAIWADSGRPVHYRQVRVGQGGRLFRLLKFRTMVGSAEAEGPRWADPDDPRVTRVGRWLRKTRLDELPQFLHVLRGEMSLVGPRPERPEFLSMLEEQIPFYRTRLIVKPGITGWAQVNHPYGDSVEDAKAKLEYDLYYIKHRALAFDLQIVAQTLWTVIRFEGT